MKIESYKTRIIDRKIETYLKIFGAISIEGPKWCGKTYSGRNAAKSEFLIASPNGNFNNKQIASLDLNIALEGEKPHLIDEWQEIPSIWDAVRCKVDEKNDKGLFILTGSTSINKSSYIHSGTGRIARLKMRPMSLYESLNSDGKISLKDICYKKAQNVLTGEVSLDKLLDLILIGGWPANIGLNEEEGRLVAKEYINSVLKSDIFKVDNIKRDSHKLELLLRSLARNESTTVTNSKLVKDIKDIDSEDINIDSITSYLNLINDLYLVENLPPFSNKIRSSLRVKQSEKRHFVDPSLVCALLNVTKEKLLSDFEFLGFAFESLVIRDLLTYVDGFNAKLYHYQDYNNDEMDAIIELEDGEWCGVEIKLGAHQIDKAAQNLVKINNKIINKGGKGAQALIVVCGLTNAAYLREDGVYVVPITSLKD